MSQHTYCHGTKCVLGHFVVGHNVWEPSETNIQRHSQASLILYLVVALVNRSRGINEIAVAALRNQSIYHNRLVIKSSSSDTDGQIEVISTVASLHLSAHPAHISSLQCYLLLIFGLEFFSQG